MKLRAARQGELSSSHEREGHRFSRLGHEALTVELDAHRMCGRP
jgi:hypothetical protein